MSKKSVPMMPSGSGKAKLKAILVLLVLVVLVVKFPAEAAEWARKVGGGLEGAAGSLATFTEHLTA